MATTNYQMVWDVTNKKWTQVIAGAGAVDHVERPTFEDIKLNDASAPTGAASRSHLWHDSTEGELYLLNETELIKRRPHDDQPLSNSWFDDFSQTAAANPAAGNAYGFGDSASVNFYTASAAGTLVQYLGEAKHPGGVYWDIGSAIAGHISSVYSTRAFYPHTLARGLKTFGAGIRLNAAAVTNDYMVGMVDAVSTMSSDGMYFECLNADSNWFAVTSVGGSRTRTDTGIAIAVSQWLDLEVDCRNNSSIKFYIDNVLVATHTNNIPTEDLQMAVAQAYRGTNTNMVLDYWYWTTKATREY